MELSSFIGAAGIMLTFGTLRFLLDGKDESSFVELATLWPH